MLRLPKASCNPNIRLKVLNLIINISSKANSLFGDLQTKKTSCLPIPCADARTTTYLTHTGGRGRGSMPKHLAEQEREAHNSP